MSDATRVRSPNYPAFSLKEAVDKITTLFNAIQRSPAPREVIAKGLGYNSLNGASATAISALNKYGLLEGRGDDLRVSDRAMTILHPHSDQERSDAIRAAAVEPRLFAELAERFPDGVRNEALLKNYLLRNGFAMSAVTAAIHAYRETSEFVHQEAGGYDSATTQRSEAPSMHAQNQPQVGHSQMVAPPISPQMLTAQPSDNDRLIQRIGLQDGSFVELRASKGMDTAFALSVLEAQLPAMKLVTELEEKKRKAESAVHDENQSRKKEESGE